MAIVKHGTGEILPEQKQENQKTAEKAEWTPQDQQALLAEDEVKELDEEEESVPGATDPS